MKTAYICSPYSGDTKRNKEYARELTLKAIKELKEILEVCKNGK